MTAIGSPLYEQELPHGGVFLTTAWFAGRKAQRFAAAVEATVTQILLAAGRGSEITRPVALMFLQDAYFGFESDELLERLECFDALEADHAVEALEDGIAAERELGECLAGLSVKQVCAELEAVLEPGVEVVKIPRAQIEHWLRLLPACLNHPVGLN